MQRIALSVLLVATFGATTAFTDCEPEEPTCPQGTIWDADADACVSGCFDNSDCPGNQVCQEVWCLTEPCHWQCMEPPCQGDQDCAEGQWCHNGSCRDDGWCFQPQDCVDQQLPHGLCMGQWSCEHNQCVYQCSAQPVNECTAVPDGTWGMCEMLMGVVWNGTQCAYASGCGCDAATDPLCGYVYPDFASCQTATSHCPVSTLH